MRCARPATRTDVGARRSRALLAATSALALASSCGLVREGSEPGLPECPSYEATVAPVLENQCGACHVKQAKGGYSVASWLDVMQRSAAGSFRVVSGDPSSAFLLAVRGESAPHVALDPSRAALLSDWVVRCGAEPRLGDPSEPKFHASGWASPSDAVQFHGLTLRDAGFDTADCRTCHGDDLRGGKSKTDCNVCHLKGPFDCGTCHGSASSAAPPKALDGSSLTTALGVGAHQKHLVASATHKAFDCVSCHPPVKNFDDDDHLYRGGVFDASRVAKVVLTAAPDAGVSPSWDRATATCTNVGCHTPNPNDTAAKHPSPTWTKVDQDEAKCGNCHGLPPSTHADDRCELCHDPGYADGGVNLALHLNGVVDLRGNAQCDACHAGPQSPQFRDLHGNTDPKVRTVGAHQAHLFASKYRGPMGCEACHLVPATVTSPGHIDSPPPADVFVSKPADGGLAWVGGAQPAYASATATCTNVACHGAGLLAQDSASWLTRAPVWNGPSSQVSCGTCHSLPPIDARPEHDGGTVLGCTACHGRSIDAAGRLVFHTDDAGVRTTEHLDGLVTGN